MRAYYLLLYKVWRAMQWSRQQMRFRRRESLTEATASTMVFVWSNWVFAGIFKLLETSYLGKYPKSTVTDFGIIGIGMAGLAFIYWGHLRLLKSTSYQAYTTTFFAQSRPGKWLVNSLLLALLIGLYVSPWLTAKWVLD